MFQQGEDVEICMSLILKLESGELIVQKSSDLLSMQQSSQRGPVSILTLLPQNKWPDTKRGIQGNVMQSFSLSPAQSHSKIHRQPRWPPWSTPPPPSQCHALPASPEFTSLWGTEGEPPTKVWQVVCWPVLYLSPCVLFSSLPTDQPCCCNDDNWIG